jgi:hypothetical protein
VAVVWEVMAVPLALIIPAAEEEEVQVDIMVLEAMEETLHLVQQDLPDKMVLVEVVAAVEVLVTMVLPAPAEAE